MWAEEPLRLDVPLGWSLCRALKINPQAVYITDWIRYDALEGFNPISAVAPDVWGWSENVVCVNNGPSLSVTIFRFLSDSALTIVHAENMGFADIGVPFLRLNEGAKRMLPSEFFVQYQVINTSLAALANVGFAVRLGTTFR